MSQDKLGAAIDVGTTTVALHLIELGSNKKITTVSGLNAQSPYGADVTSRIKYCADNGHEKLTKLIREQISAMITEACSQTGASTDNIEKISIAANTVMQHLIAGYSPVSMGVAPFTTVSLFGEEHPAWDDLPVAVSTQVYYTPAISAYVGGDITAGLLAAGFEDILGPALFIDIGTNGEIVLKSDGTYYCCATAAGPAFEGAEITMGMIATSGAINHVYPSNDKSIKYSTIGGGEPTGICGSGLLDTLAVLLETGDVDKTGRLLCGERLYLTGDTGDTGDEKGVYITAGDIRKLQLAKAAIAAGIETLLHFAEISEADITSLALAGGFGSYMDLQSAASIGLFPKSLLPVAKTYGNTAGEGAALAVGSEDVCKRLKEIQKNCEYVELSSIALFNDKFVDHMAF